MTKNIKDKIDNFEDDDYAEVFGNVESVRRISESMSVDPDSWLNAQSGKESLTLKVGDIAITTDKSQLRPGLKVKVENTILVNGYARYFAAGVWHRADDLVKLSE